MVNKPVIPKAMILPNVHRQTPWQIHEAQKNTWEKITKEDIDLEEFKKTKLISYFGHELKLEILSDYDRRFYHGDDDPKVKLQRIRDKIFKEEEERIFPVVVSHIYGHRKTNLEGKPIGSFKRVRVMTGTYRRNHPNLKPDKKLPRQEAVVLTENELMNKRNYPYNKQFVFGWKEVVGPGVFDIGRRGPLIWIPPDRGLPTGWKAALIEKE